MATETPYVLFVDDDEQLTRQLIRQLSQQGLEYSCVTGTTADEGIALLKEHRPNAAVVDLSLDESVGPDSGLQLIDQLLAVDPTLRVLVLTGHSSEEFALKALERGAASFLKKPVDVLYLYALLQDAVSFSQLKRRYQELSTDADVSRSLPELRTNSPRMKETVGQLIYAASTKLPVLLVGETGSGKGVMAGAIHKLSPVCDGPFIRFQPNFGGADLVSSELFGHTRGAFTGATIDRRGLLQEAHQGTIFLDEVDELPTQTQVMLLQTLQERVFRKLGSNQELFSDFRLIAATNRSVEESLKEGKLRDDFYHRLSHLRIDLPPLRERLEDIPLLVEQALLTLATAQSLTVHSVSEAALARLRSHAWPGNVRELMGKIEAAAYKAQFHQRSIIEPEDLQLDKSTSPQATDSGSFRDRVRAFEQELVASAMAANDDNQSKAAESLQLDRSSFRRILNRSQ